MPSERRKNFWNFFIFWAQFVYFKCFKSNTFNAFTIYKALFCIAYTIFIYLFVYFHWAMFRSFICQSKRQCQPDNSYKDEQEHKLKLLNKYLFWYCCHFFFSWFLFIFCSIFNREIIYPHRLQFHQKFKKHWLT